MPKGKRKRARAPKVKDFEPCPHGKTEKHNCAEVVQASELLGIADDYLTVACELTAWRRDASSQIGMERVGKALTFMSKIIDLIGGAD